MQKNILDFNEKNLLLKYMNNYGGKVMEKMQVSNNSKPKEITLLRSIGYGLTDMMGGGAFTIIGAWLLFFYTTYAGLSAMQAASIVGVARIVDAITSLLMGSLTDNFYKTRLGKRFGRRRFFLIIGAPLMFEFILLWIPGMGYLYYLITYLLFEIIAAMVLIPWETLPTEMTKDYEKRTKLSSTRMFISTTGVFLATFVPGQLFKIMGQDNASSFLVNAIIFSCIYAICIFTSYKVTWERPVTEEMIADIKNAAINKSGNILIDQLKDYISTFKLKTFRKHLIIYLLSFTAKDVFNSVFAYYGISVLLVNATTSANVLSLSFIGPVIIIISGFLMIKYGPRFLYTISFSSILFALVGFYLLYETKPSNMIVILFIIGFIYNVGLAILQFTPWNVFPLVPDLDELITKQHREGIYAAVMTFVRKSTVAVAAVSVGIALNTGGYIKGSVVQSPQAQNIIVNILVFGTGTLILIALLFAVTFKLNRTTHSIVKYELNRLKAGGSKNDVPLETKMVIEELTGYKYEDIWKDN